MGDFSDWEAYLVFFTVVPISLLVEVDVARVISSNFAYLPSTLFDFTPNKVLFFEEVRTELNLRRYLVNLISKL